MSITILAPNDALWQEHFDALTPHLLDPFFTPAYYALQDSHAECFCFKEGGDVLLYPYCKVSLSKLGYIHDEEFYDIEGAYGYNGVLTNRGDDEAFLQRARDAFCAYAKEANFVAEFMRLNPLAPNFAFFQNTQLTCANQNIVVNLRQNNIWMDAYEHSTRKNVNKAIRLGLYARILTPNELKTADLELFYTIYTQTMQRNEASEEYFFTLAYFTKIAKKLPNNTLFIFVYHETKAVAVELVLLAGVRAYSFLGGTLEAYFSMRPNDFLKHTLIEALKGMGKHFFVLGGGVQKGDGIFLYKKNFSKNGVYDFFIAKGLHNAPVYEATVKQWRQRVDLERQKRYENYHLKTHYGVTQ